MIDKLKSLPMKIKFMQAKKNKQNNKLKTKIINKLTINLY